MRFDASQRSLDPSLLIVGREREQQALRGHLDALMDGHGILLLVSGEAGIGKTTVVREFASQARERGALVLSGGCYDLTTTPPYGPWSEAVLGYRPDKGQAPAPAWFDDPTESGTIGSQTALFEVTRQFFEEISQAQPLIVILEDLHWSDQASLELLRFLARRLAQSAVLVAVTYRDDEITRRHELYQLLPVLVRESQAQRVHLNPLDGDALRALIQGRYDLSDVNAKRLADHLMQRSEGNPFFAGEILYELEDMQLLKRADDGWVLTELDRAPVPPLLHQLIQDRITQLTPETRVALQVAAVIGQEVALDLWRNVTALQEPELDRIIAESMAATLLQETRDRTGLQFRHALLRETLYDSLVLSRRRVLHGQIGQELEKTPNPDPDRVAHHFQQAGHPRAVHWLIQAGWRAERSYAMRIASRLYETAETILEGDPDTAQARGWLRFHCAVVVRFTDREGGLAFLEEASRVAIHEEDPVLAAHSLAMHGMMRAWGGELRMALVEVDAACQALNRTSHQDHAQAWKAITSLYPASIYADHSVSLGHPLFRIGVLPGANILTQIHLYWMSVTGQFRQAVELGEPYVAHVSAAADDELTVHGLCRFAYSAIANAYDMLGHPETAQEWRRRELAAAQVFKDQANINTSRMQALLHLMTYHAERVAERRTVIGAALTASAPLRALLEGDSQTELFEVQLNFLEGRWDKARSLLKKTWTPGLSYGCRPIWLSITLREQGDAQLAWEQIGKIFPEGPATEPGNVEYVNATLGQRLAINLSLDANDHDQARAWLEAYDRWLEWSGAVIGRAERELLWARYYQAVGDDQKARQSAAQALADASSPRQPLALIAVHRCLGELIIDKKRFVEAEEHLRRSLALAEACAAPYEQALTLLIMARLDSETGSVDAAWQKIDRVRAICTPLNAVLALQQATATAARLSVRRGQPVHPAGLTPREMEVLRLVAQGLTDAEVAERLFISPRTVGTHLTSLYNKLGVNSRVEATRFALEHGLDGSANA